MFKIIGLNHGLNGDAVMNTVSCRIIKELYPNSELTFALSSPYKNILPLFDKHPYIDKFHIWEGDDRGLTQNDHKFIIDNKFQIVFNPFPQHISHNWYNFRHYINETLAMHRLPQTHNLQCYLNPWFGKNDKYKDYITISAFPSKSNNLSKTLSLDNWWKIVESINKLGFKCLQLGGKYDAPIYGAENPDLSWIEAAQALYSSKLQITTDTSWAWIGSAYQHKVIGLYGLNYPDMIHPWTHFPINPYAKYFWNKNVNDIPVDSIIEEVKNTLK